MAGPGSKQHTCLLSIVVFFERAHVSASAKLTFNLKHSDVYTPGAPSCLSASSAGGTLHLAPLVASTAPWTVVCRTIGQFELPRPPPAPQRTGPLRLLPSPPCWTLHNTPAFCQRLLSNHGLQPALRFNLPLLQHNLLLLLPLPLCPPQLLHPGSWLNSCAGGIHHKQFNSSMEK